MLANFAHRVNHALGCHNNISHIFYFFVLEIGREKQQFGFLILKDEV
jgi:hypothetical protein